MIVAVDFDDTITFPSKYPVTGKVRKDAVKYITKMYEDGVHLILWTCRVDEFLNEALQVLKDAGILHCFCRVNENFTGKSRKVYAHFYIDDKSMRINWKRFYKIVSKMRRRYEH